MLSVALVFISILIYIYHSLTKNLDYWDKRGVKNEKPWPLIGNMLPMISKKVSPNEFIKGIYNTFPGERYSGIFQFRMPILMLRDPELIKEITIKHFEHFTDRVGFISEFNDPLWGKNLVGSVGERWRKLRQILTPVFTSSKMRSLFFLIDDCARNFTQHFQDKEGEIVNVTLRDIFSRFSNDVIATAAFGIEVDSLKNEDNAFYTHGRELTTVTGATKILFLLNGSYTWLVKLLGLRIVDKRVGNFFEGVINDTIKTREKNNIIRLDLLHLLMLAQKGKLSSEDNENEDPTGFSVSKDTYFGKQKNNATLSNEDILAQTLVCYFGSYETISTTLCFTAYELCGDKEVQDRLRKEIFAIEGNLTYEKVAQMNYLDMIISEVLRKWSQGLWVDRKCTKDFVIEPKKYGEVRLELKKGDQLWIPIHGIHMDPEYFPNPEKFDPERFSVENRPKMKSSAYIPFGSGPRKCIASRLGLLETKILMYHLLREFEIVPIEETKIPVQLSLESYLLMPIDGIRVGLKRLHHS